MPDVRDQIKSVIKDRALIQAEIARRADIPPATLSAALNKRQRLDANTVYKICQVMGLSFDELMAYSPYAKEAPVCNTISK
jgi:transcriptional regulator with XRE-family HTH domain